MIADSLSRIAMSSGLAASLSRATDFARAQGHGEVTLEHMLLALTDDPDAALVLAASNVNVAELTREIDDHLSQLPSRGGIEEGDLVVAADMRRILEATAAAARGGRRREINGAIVLAAIIGDGKSAAAHVLSHLGLTFEGAIRALQTRPSPAPDPAPARAVPAPDAEAILASARERVQSRTAPPQRRPAAEEPVALAPPPAAAKDLAPALAPQPIPEPQHAPEPPSMRNVEAMHPRWGQAPDPHHGSDAPAFEQHSAPPPAYLPEPAEPPPEPHYGHQHAPHFDVAGHHAPPPGQYGHDIQGYEEPPYDIAVGSPPMPTHAPFPPPIPVPDAWQEPHFDGPPAHDEAYFDNGHAHRGFGEEMTVAPAEQHGWAPPPAPPSGPAFDAPPPMAMPAPPAPSPMTPGRRMGPPPLAPWPDESELPAARAPGMSQSHPRTAQQFPEGGGARRPMPRGEIGQLVENIPRAMRVAVPALIEVRIARADVQALAEGLQGGGAAYQHEVTVTKAMSVRLRAPDGGFFIETASPETQWIDRAMLMSEDDFASWRWHVTPRQTGRRRLQLIISARTVSADGLAAETAMPDQVITVRVRANYGQAVRRWAGWGAAAIGGGLLAKFGEGTADAWLPAVTKLLGG